MRLILYNSLLIRINSSPLYIDSSRHGTHFIYIPQKPPKTGSSARDYTLYRLYPLDSPARLIRAFQPVPFLTLTIPSRLYARLLPYACACAYAYAYLQHRLAASPLTATRPKPRPTDRRRRR